MAFFVRFQCCSCHHARLHIVFWIEYPQTCPASKQPSQPNPQCHDWWYRKQDPTYAHTAATSARRLDAFHAFKDEVPFIHGEDWADGFRVTIWALHWWFFGLGSTEFVSKGTKKLVILTAFAHHRSLKRRAPPPRDRDNIQRIGFKPGRQNGHISENSRSLTMVASWFPWSM